ncbi:lipid asymmetry maintenance protein MlaB [Roseateles sp. BYS180W]|uniref:Lipid asymmetry maintenance protein MlaB n=1 Tax=Roseateles rivi TaxID=3299028 RepID=A0ABW7FU66_9BURK
MDYNTDSGTPEGVAELPPDTEALAEGLGASWTIPNAAALHEKLMQRCGELPSTESTMVLELSGVEEVDSTGIQLLLSLRRALHERGQQLQLLHPSFGLVMALTLYGLDEQLRPLVAPEEHGS